MMASFRIKVCGVRRVDDLTACANAGVDAVGINGYPGSIRHVDPTDPRSAELARQARTLGLLRIGVFVNASRDHMLGARDRWHLDAIQFHGDESPSLAGELVADSIDVIRAVRLPMGPRTPDEIQAMVDPWLTMGTTILLDADAGAAFGGGGRSLDWPSIRAWADAYPGTWILAGGLNAENVAEAIRISGARSVDVASGVESLKGIKSPARIAEFASAVDAAWRAERE